MKDTISKLYIPVRTETHTDNGFFETFLNEISDYSNNSKLIYLIDSLNIPENNEYPLIDSIELKSVSNKKGNNKEAELINKLSEKYSFFHANHDYLLIDLKLKNIERYNYKPEYYTYLINDYMIRFNLLLNLTYSVNIDFLNGIIFFDDSDYVGQTDQRITNTMFAFEHASEMKWPQIKNLKLQDTINWFDKFNLHPNFKSKNKAQRAINAFSRIFGDLMTNESPNLFWVMLGIEAILSKGSQNVLNQIKEKSIIILGEPKDYKTKLNKLYDYRSRLIHGDFDIYPEFYSDYNTFEKEYYNYLAFAESILIALIRELIVRKKTEFEFELKLI